VAVGEERDLKEQNEDYQTSQEEIKQNFLPGFLPFRAGKNKRGGPSGPPRFALRFIVSSFPTF